MTKEQRDRASHAYKLLYAICVIPGSTDDNSFDLEKFQDWLTRVKKLSTESGHLKVALTHVGQILANSPPDPTGLWLLKPIAKVLNEKSSAPIRKGFYNETITSRGAFWGSGGQQERQLAQLNYERAEELESSSFHRFEVTLRELSDHYRKYAEREEKEAELGE